MLPLLLAGGAGALAGGLFGGGGGGGGLFSSIVGAGMGMAGMQAFGGGSGSGYAPMFNIPMSPEGKKLQTTLYKTTKKQWETGLLPENLASIYMGQVKREEAKTHRQARGFLTSMAGGRTRGGTEVKALLTEGGRRMQGVTEPAQWKVGQRKDEIRDAMKMMQQIRGIEMQTPILKAQAQMYQQLMDKGQRAVQGQALGNIAQWAAMMKTFS